MLTALATVAAPLVSCEHCTVHCPQPNGLFHARFCKSSPSSLAYITQSAAHRLHNAEPWVMMDFSAMSTCNAYHLQG